jgi:hypothetical protein
LHKRREISVIAHSGCLARIGIMLAHNDNTLGLGKVATNQGSGNPFIDRLSNSGAHQLL